MIMDPIWQYLPADIVSLRIITCLDSQAFIMLIEYAILNEVFFRELVLPAFKHLIMQNKSCERINSLIGVAVINHMKINALYEFFETYPIPHLCTIPEQILNQYFQAMIKRGDMDLILYLIADCNLLIEIAIKYMIDRGHVYELRTIISKYGLNLKCILYAVYDGNRVIVRDIINYLQNDKRDIPGMLETFQYYKELESSGRYEDIPYIIDISYQLLDAKTKWWLNRILRILSKILKTNEFKKFIVNFYKHEMDMYERERREYIADMMYDY